MTEINIWNRYSLVNNIKQIPLDDVVSACYAQLHQKTEDYFILLTEKKGTLLLKQELSGSGNLSLIFVALELKNGSHIVISNSVCKKLKKRLDQGFKLSNSDESSIKRIIDNHLLLMRHLSFFSS